MRFFCELTNARPCIIFYYRYGIFPQRLPMRQTITISLPEEIKRELDQLAETEDLSRSEIIRKSIKNYLFIGRFRSLRRRMLGQAQQEGVYTDQDVFDRLS